MGAKALSRRGAVSPHAHYYHLSPSCARCIRTPPASYSPTTTIKQTYMRGMGDIIDFAGFDQPEQWTPHLQDVFDIVSPNVRLPWCRGALTPRAVGLGLIFLAIGHFRDHRGERGRLRDPRKLPRALARLRRRHQEWIGGPTIFRGAARHREGVADYAGLVAHKCALATSCPC